LQVNPRFDLSKEVIDLREKRKQVDWPPSEIMLLFCAHCKPF
jgi:hypothetical protein